jgi:iron-sulfur cluster assembly accessory protein
MIITEEAKEKIREIADSEGIGHYSVRVKTVGGGCGGLQFEMEYDDAPTELDEVIEEDGITVLVDPLSYQYMAEMTVDYIAYAMGEGFKFSGGGSTSCACGSSVSF